MYAQNKKSFELISINANTQGRSVERPLFYYIQKI